MSPDAPSLLVAADIGKRFGNFSVLNNVDLTIGDGEAIGIVGPNGAGKTTLLNIISGAYPPSAGSIAFAGQNVTLLRAAARCRRGIARTHQIPRPFAGMTVFENLLVAAQIGGDLKRDEAYDACYKSLETCGMTKLANRKAATLGLLDRKRLELSRALTTGPKLLLLDEIGGGLTDAEAGQLIRIIQEINARGVAVVWIEHIVHALLRVVNRLICMDAGKILADGAPQAVMSNPAVIDAYMGPGRKPVAVA